MGKSKILDKIVEDEIRLEVRALSADMGQPLNLDAVLVDYDEEGFLCRGKESRDPSESAYYIPKNAVAFMKFSKESLSQNSRNGHLENLEQIELEEGTYSAFGVTYNVKTRELRRGNQKKLVRGERYHQILSELFRVGSKSTIGPDVYEEGLSDAKDAYSAVSSRMNYIRNILKDFELTIFHVPNQGYSLRQKD